MLYKLAMTTLVSTALWAGCLAVIRSDWLSFRNDEPGLSR